MSRNSLKKACPILKTSMKAISINIQREREFRIEYNDQCTGSRDNNIQLINFSGPNPEPSINYKDFTLHYSKKDNMNI